jgi:acyl-CoA synthetase (NDP forming)
VATAARHVRDVVEACGRKGAGAVVVMAGDFAETGAAGAARQAEVVRAAHGLGMRVVGPNCIGVLNTEPGVSMNATTVAALPDAGPVGFASQSGGVGAAMLAEAHGRGLGLSSFVSLGNKADVSGNDALLWWEQDPATEIVLLHLESFGNPRRFARIARRISRAKPIVAVKSGTSVAGARGATRHSAALPRSERAVEALFHHTGVIRVETLEELFDTAAVLALQPLPRGRRVGIVADAGGAGVLAADACVHHGLAVPELRPETRRTLRSVLPPGAGTANPVDLLDAVRPDEFGRAVAALADTGEVDAVLVVVTAPGASAAAVTAAVARELGSGTGSDRLERAVTVVAATLGSPGGDGGRADTPRRVPCFTYPETAARALAHVADYASWRSQPDEPEPLVSDMDPNAARRHIADAADPASAEVWISGEGARRVVGAYGIACDDAPADAGAPPARRRVVGFVQDPAFGPVVMLGDSDSAGPPRGGGSCLAPLTRAEARRLTVADAGEGEGDENDALVDLVLRLGRMAEDLPEVAEAWCGPLRLSAGRATVLEARVRVSAPPAPPDDRRHLA